MPTYVHANNNVLGRAMTIDASTEFLIITTARARAHKISTADTEN